jgi:hypothetical protein
VYPVQSEVSSLDAYIQNFVWGGLQRTTNESSSYGVYGIPDWKTNRLNNTLSLGRGYDYPHIIVMYYGMYKVAKYHPEITTLLSATEYFTRAYGTAVAMWTYGGGQATQVGLMNETVLNRSKPTPNMPCSTPARTRRWAAAMFPPSCKRRSNI